MSQRFPPIRSFTWKHKELSGRLERAAEIRKLARVCPLSERVCATLTKPPVPLGISLFGENVRARRKNKTKQKTTYGGPVVYGEEGRGGELVKNETKRKNNSRNRTFRRFERAICPRVVVRGGIIICIRYAVAGRVYTYAVPAGVKKNNNNDIIVSWGRDRSAVFAIAS